MYAPYCFHPAVYVPLVPVTVSPPMPVPQLDPGSSKSEDRFVPTQSSPPQLAKSAFPNKLSLENKTEVLDAALYRMIRVGNRESAKELLEKGASLSRNSGRKESNIIHQFGYFQDKPSLRMAVLDLGGDPNLLDKKGKSIVEYAVRNSNYDMLQFMADELKADMNIWNIRRVPPIHIATQYKQSEMITALVQRYGANVNAADHLNKTPLMLAIKNQDEQTVDLLVNELQADVEAKDCNGDSIQEYARKSENKQIQKTIQKRIESLKSQDELGRDIEQRLQALERLKHTEQKPIKLETQTRSVKIKERQPLRVLGSDLKFSLTLDSKAQAQLEMIREVWRKADEQKAQQKNSLNPFAQSFQIQAEPNPLLAENLPQDHNRTSSLNAMQRSFRAIFQDVSGLFDRNDSRH